ncbi:hypothetical protein [Dawidia soli]|uniref:DUF4374 domain-containing protein n=1 Tax=Dawidia soli TaxID=2782352 RepID=A0AAP2D725_9BACT|nr:hypothetical protein [Dawidia soli]MBT1686581.1 hypothetical protein [Dawidia soli]
MQQSTIRTSLLLLLVAPLMMMCGEEPDPRTEAQKFVSIYDNNQLDAVYFPIDVKQTADGGYLMLAAKGTITPGATTGNPNFYYTYLLKADKNGNFVSENELESNFVSPVGDLAAIDNRYYFFCRDSKTFLSKLIAVDEDGNLLSGKDIQYFNEAGQEQLSITYPAAAGVDVNEKSLILMGYDNKARKSVIVKMDTSGATNGSSFKGFEIGAGGDKEVEAAIIDHFTKGGRRLPFQAGRIPGGPYYFNGFYNYSLSLCFTNFQGDAPMGVVLGQQYKGGVSALAPLGNNQIALASFNFGENFFLPRQEVAPTVQANISALNPNGFSLPELTPNAFVKILHTTLHEKNVVIYASTTQSRQIGLYFYNADTGAFMSSRYLGFSNPYEVSSLIATADGGLAVCGTTYVAGRFSRVCLFKLSKGEISENVK